jgi:hypothetical protein
VAGLFHQYFQYGFWKVFVIRKHRLPGSWRHLVPATFVALNVALLFAAAVSRMGGASVGFGAFGWIWLGLAATYGSASLVASLLAAKRHGWATLPWLPVVFGAYHFSCGFGFLIGMFRSLTKPSRVFANESVFARITR